MAKTYVYDERTYEILKEHLRDLRKHAGLTQMQLGELIGVTTQTIKNMENGNTPISKCSCIALWAIFYGLSLYVCELAYFIDDLECSYAFLQD